MLDSNISFLNQIHKIILSFVANCTILLRLPLSAAHSLLVTQGIVGNDSCIVGLFGGPQRKCGELGQLLILFGLENVKNTQLVVSLVCSNNSVEPFFDYLYDFDHPYIS